MFTSTTTSFSIRGAMGTATSACCRCSVHVHHRSTGRPGLVLGAVCYYFVSIYGANKKALIILSVSTVESTGSAQHSRAHSMLNLHATSCIRVYSKWIDWIATIKGQQEFFPILHIENINIFVKEDCLRVQQNKSAVTIRKESIVTSEKTREGLLWPQKCEQQRWCEMMIFIYISSSSYSKFP